MPVLFLLLLLLPAQSLHASPDLFSFAESLAAEQDYYRAITEYKRFLHYFPRDSRAAEAQLAIGRSFLAGERWQQADAALEKTWQLYPATKTALEAQRLYAQSAYQQQNYSEARRRYQWLKEQPGSDPAEAELQTGMSYLQESRLPEARDSFSQLNSPEANKLLAELEEYRHLPRKSPRLAGTLSAILPGAGQFYAERPQQAAIAFALNAAFIYGAIEAWNNENYTLAGILSLFEVGWYGGNVYNAMNNVHKYNRALEKRFQQRFKVSLGVVDQRPRLVAEFRY